MNERNQYQQFTGMCSVFNNFLRDGDFQDDSFQERLFTQFKRAEHIQDDVSRQLTALSMDYSTPQHERVKMVETIKGNALKQLQDLHLQGRPDASGDTERYPRLNNGALDVISRYIRKA